MPCLSPSKQGSDFRNSYYLLSGPPSCLEVSSSSVISDSVRMQFASDVDEDDEEMKNIEYDITQSQVEPEYMIDAEGLIEEYLANADGGGDGGHGDDKDDCDSYEDDHEIEDGGEGEREGDLNDNAEGAAAGSGSN